MKKNILKYGASLPLYPGGPIGPCKPGSPCVPLAPSCPLLPTSPFGPSTKILLSLTLKILEMIKQSFNLNRTRILFASAV